MMLDATATPHRHEQFTFRPVQQGGLRHGAIRFAISLRSDGWYSWVVSEEALWCVAGADRALCQAQNAVQTEIQSRTSSAQQMPAGMAGDPTRHFLPKLGGADTVGVASFRDQQGQA